MFLTDPERWVLKGAGNLLARIPEDARYSLDIDLLYQGGLDEAVLALREAARLDIGDHFRFEIATARKSATRGIIRTHLHRSRRSR